MGIEVVENQVNSLHFRWVVENVFPTSECTCRKLFKSIHDKLLKLHVYILSNLLGVCIMLLTFADFFCHKKETCHQLSCKAFFGWRTAHTMRKLLCLEKPLCTKGGKDDFDECHESFWALAFSIIWCLSLVLFVFGLFSLSKVAFLSQKGELQKFGAPCLLLVLEIQRISLLCDPTFFTHVFFIWLFLGHRNFGCPASQYASGSPDGFSAPYPRIFCIVILVVTISSASWGLCTPIYFRTCIYIIVNQ